MIKSTVSPMAHDDVSRRAPNFRLIRPGLILNLSKSAPAAQWSGDVRRELHLPTQPQRSLSHSSNSGLPTMNLLQRRQKSTGRRSDRVIEAFSQRNLAFVSEESWSDFHERYRTQTVRSECWERRRPKAATKLLRLILCGRSKSSKSRGSLSPSSNHEFSVRSFAYESDADLSESNSFSMDRR